MTQPPLPDYPPQLPPSAESTSPPPENPKKGMAMAGLVLGVLAFGVPLVWAMCSPHAGVWPLIVGLLLALDGMILSIIAISRRTAGGTARAGLILNVTLLVLVGAALLTYRPTPSRDMAKAAGCSMNLSNIGKAIATYQGKYYDDQFPPNLDALLQEGGYMSDRGLLCPADTLTNGTSYFYCAPLDDDADADTVIIACDIAPMHPGKDNRPNDRRHYLRSDLSVQRATESEFQQLLQKPENRRFAEELTKGTNMTPRERVTYIAPRGDETTSPQGDTP